MVGIFKNERGGVFEASHTTGAGIMGCGQRVSRNVKGLLRWVIGKARERCFGCGK